MEKTIKVPESLPWVMDENGYVHDRNGKDVGWHNSINYTLHAANLYPELVRTLEVIANPEQGDQPAHILAARILAECGGE